MWQSPSRLQLRAGFTPLGQVVGVPIRGSAPSFPWAFQHSANSNARADRDADRGAKYHTHRGSLAIVLFSWAPTPAKATDVAPATSSGGLWS